MIKGIQKNIFVIKNTGSSIFSEAHFMLREDMPLLPTNTDMLLEAKRIISENVVSPDSVMKSLGSRKRERNIRIALFFAGMILGGAVSAVLMLVF